MQLIRAPRVHRIHQVAATLNLSRATVYRLIGVGELLRVKIGVRAVGITDESLQAFLARRVMEG